MNLLATRVPSYDRIHSWVLRNHHCAAEGLQPTSRQLYRVIHKCPREAIFSWPLPTVLTVSPIHYPSPPCLTANPRGCFSTPNPLTRGTQTGTTCLVNEIFADKTLFSQLMTTSFFARSPAASEKHRSLQNSYGQFCNIIMMVCINLSLLAPLSPEA